MTRLLRFACAMLILTSLHCFADSIRNFKISAYVNIEPNVGGDNVGAALVGGAVNLIVGGGTPFQWFDGIGGYDPGSNGGGSTTIFFDSVHGTIGGTSADDMTISSADFNTGIFTFPTNGRDFTVSMPASLGVVVLVGCDEHGCTTYNLTSKPGTLTMSFYYSDGLYFANQASFVSTSTVPEPATLALLGIGLAAMPWRKAKNVNRPQ